MHTSVQNLYIQQEAQRKIDLLCIGEPMVEFTHQTNNTWTQSFGGDANNVAIALSRQDKNAAIFTKLGADEFGQELLRFWQKEHINSQTVASDTTGYTATYFIRYSANGHTFSYCRKGSAASLLESSDITPSLVASIAQSKALFFSGICQALSDSACQTTFALLKIAKATGTTIVYDPNLRLKLWDLDKAQATINATIPHVDILRPSLDDAKILTGLFEPEKIADYYLALGPKLVVLTLGAQGVLVATPKHKTHIRAPYVKLVDASGAGDCFTGCFIAHLLSTNDPIAAARYAVAATSIAVQGYGAIAPIPYKNQVFTQLQTMPIQ